MSASANLYFYVGDHATTLASGLRVAPGDEVIASAVDAEADAALINEGLLIDAQKGTTVKEKTK